MSDSLAAAEKLAAKCKAAFAKYDVNGNGTIERDELTKCLEDLGVLKDVPKKNILKFVSDQFGRLDTNDDSHLDYDEFAAFYNVMMREKAMLAKGSEFGKGSDLHKVFSASISGLNFNNKNKMKRKNFKKLCEHCKVLHKTLFTPTDAKTTFAMVEDKKSFINYEAFCRGLTIAAEKRGMAYADLVAIVVGAGAMEWNESSGSESSSSSSSSSSSDSGSGSDTPEADLLDTPPRSAPGSGSDTSPRPASPDSEVDSDGYKPRKRK